MTDAGSSTQPNGITITEHELEQCRRANQTGNDVSQLIPLVDAVPSILGRGDRPRRRPRVLLGDRGYHDKYAIRCAGSAHPRGSHAAASMSETSREEQRHDCPQPDRP